MLTLFFSIKSLPKLALSLCAQHRKQNSKCIYSTPISRYIYVCYAADLAAGGERLLNILVSVGILALCVPWIIIYPIIGDFNVFIYLYIISIYISQEMSTSKTIHSILSRARSAPKPSSRSLKTEPTTLITASNPSRYCWHLVSSEQRKNFKWYITLFARLPDPDCHHHLHHLGPEAEQEVRHQEVPPPPARHEVTLPPHLPLHHESHSTFRYISTITLKPMDISKPIVLR